MNHVETIIKVCSLVTALGGTAQAGASGERLGGGDAPAVIHVDLDVLRDHQRALLGDGNCAVHGVAHPYL